MSRCISIRNAINSTIAAYSIDERLLAQGAQMQFAALVDFRRGERDITTKTLDSADRTVDA